MRNYGTGSRRDSREGKGRYDLISPFVIRRLAKHLELGANKYGLRNWELGQNTFDFYDSASRHMNNYLLGMRDEDHLVAAIWNLGAIVHFEELGTGNYENAPLDWETRNCKVCNTDKVFDKYEGNRKTCKDCRREYHRKHKKLKSNDVNWVENKRATHSKAYHSSGWKKNLMNKYGLTPEAYEELAKKQNYVCAICGESETYVKKDKVYRLSVDHDHLTGEIRGLLCRNHNVGLGHFSDSVEYLQNAIKYINGECECKAPVLNRDMECGLCRKNLPKSIGFDSKAPQTASKPLLEKDEETPRPLATNGLEGDTGRQNLYDQHAKSETAEMERREDYRDTYRYVHNVPTDKIIEEQLTLEGLAKYA